MGHLIMHFSPTSFFPLSYARTFFLVPYSQTLQQYDRFYSHTVSYIYIYLDLYNLSNSFNTLTNKMH
jgi:hypothetical protein